MDLNNDVDFEDLNCSFFGLDSGIWFLVFELVLECSCYRDAFAIPFREDASSHLHAQIGTCYMETRQYYIASSRVQNREDGG